MYSPLNVYGRQQFGYDSSRTEGRSRMAVRQRTRSKIYELYVELEGIEPLIWRRLLVPATITLPKLHDLLQLAMSWTNSHLHSFTIENRTFGMADVDNFEELDMLDERRHTIAAVLGASTREFLYLYDFGDSWHHRITVKTLAHPNPDWHYPLCTGGARAAPPDDVGGPPGYENSSLPSTTRNTRSTTACSPGSAARLILRASTSTPSIGCCASGDREMRKSLRAPACERLHVATTASTRRMFRLDSVSLVHRRGNPG